MKKTVLYLVSAALVASFSVGMLAGCGPNDVALAYHYYESEVDDLYNIIEEEYDHDLVYQNDLTTLGADPSVIHVTEGEEKGYYYMYNTSDPIGATGYLAYRSKNLNDWECMGVAYNPTLYIGNGENTATQQKDVTYTSFATAMYWAPEVIYDEDLGLYCMFYNASYIFHPYRFFIDMAVSEKPQGPFVQYARWIQDSEDLTAAQKAEWILTDNDAAASAGLGSGKLKVYQPLLNFKKVPSSVSLDESWSKGEPLRAGEIPGYMKVIDASPYIDEDGEKYLYFVQDLGDGHNTSAICVIKMNEDWTPDYTQMRKLTVANAFEIGDNKDDMNYPELAEGSVNEAPFMTKHGNKYYLMFSANSYTQSSYSVRVAVGDSPMGPFKKLSIEEGGWLLYGDAQYMSGTGHHSFVYTEDTTYIVYHAHVGRSVSGGARAIAFDEIAWTENADGLAVPHANGPTYSYLPVTSVEWKNIAKDATITSVLPAKGGDLPGTAEGSDVKYLNDGIIKIHPEEEFVQEYEIAEGAVEITLTFEDYREVTGLFIVNAVTWDYAVGRISKVEFEFKDGKTKKTAYTDPLRFDVNKYYPGEEYYIPGGTFALEFKPMLVKSIKITLPNVTDEVRALSEIMVLGK